MFKPFLLLSAAMLFVFGVIQAQGSMPAQGASAGIAATPSSDAQARAKRTYTNDCAMCHGANGDGKTDLAKEMQLTLPDLTDPKALAGKEDKDLFNVIRNGKDKMPPEDASRAKNEDVNALIVYIRGLAKP